MIADSTQLKSTEHAPAVTLLEVFAYGTYQDYLQQHSNGSVPSITDDAARKLKQLSILSYAQKERTLDYTFLLTALGLENVRALEDLIIDGMYHGLMKGKLDQKAGQFVVHSVMGRDVRSDQIKGLLDQLSAWASTTDQLLQGMQDKVGYIAQAAVEREKEQKQLQEDYEKVKGSLRQHPRRDADMMDTEFLSDEYALERRSARRGGAGSAGRAKNKSNASGAGRL
eukprot:TRINITY_DN6022_c0_g1_i1.p1 TRINITY_DN6022_c0_g1~~TRINITY_DN6022_c0_g1_i1.p1  ORF type:complete len:226 (+),score=45.76 TRINITY_DN6022_c0_g1_i1:116-793(+)